MKKIHTPLCRFRPLPLLAISLFILTDAIAQKASFDQAPVPRRLNFIVSSKQKKFDQAAFSFQFQVLWMYKYHRGDYYVILPGSSKEMAKKITRILRRENAMIGNIWFDSHGHFQRRRSLFEIGEEEFNYLTIRDSIFTIHLKKLTAYCDTNTNVGIGSCYGGATYALPAVENFPEQPMNGDSLMIGTSRLFNNATVYACESFVMTGIGIMNAGYAFAGMPGRKKFKDPVYKPVWEKLGEWNCYSGKKGAFEKPVTVCLHHDGRISYKQRNYLSFPKNRQKLEKRLKKFKRGNYNLAHLYQAV